MRVHGLYLRVSMFLALVASGVACESPTRTKDPAALASARASLSSSTPSPVRFSEIHYDNVGTDVQEAIEVSGPAGTDLTGWTVVLYNG